MPDKEKDNFGTLIRLAETLTLSFFAISGVLSSCGDFTGDISQTPGVLQRSVTEN